MAPIPAAIDAQRRREEPPHWVASIQIGGRWTVRLRDPGGSKVAAALERVHQHGKRFGRPKPSASSASTGFLKAATLVGVGSGTVKW